jgi:heme-degrading monooxygenase HmoA
VFLKHIEVAVRPGEQAAYLEAQGMWNRETAAAPGFLGTFCGRERDADDTVHVFVLWEDRDAYERWMGADHDRVADLARADRHYLATTVRLLDEAAPASPRLRVTGPGVDRTISWLELGRFPGVVRDVAAVTSGAVGAAVPLGSVLASIDIHEAITHVTVVSRAGGYRASIPLDDVVAGGWLAYADGGRPLDAARGGPLRLTVAQGSTLCWNVKDVARLELTAGKQPDSVPENPPH